jgi:uncharacterized protein YdeI (YjbR/CyaY-like superfamily)
VTRDEERLSFPSAAEWESWLAERHADSAGVWLRLAKKRSGVESVHYPEVLELAIAFGWIDARRQALDEISFLQRFTPRRRGSRWSKANRETALRLIESGRMRPAGLREVEAAQGDGRWDAAYDGPRTASVPLDLERALAENEAARAFFVSLDSRNRYAVLYRIEAAKRPETRARRIAQLVELLARGEKLHP